MNRVRRELARKRLGRRRRSLRSRRFGWVQRCRRWASGCYKAPNPKLQIPKKLQAPSSKTTPPHAGQGFGGGRQAKLAGTPLGFETWSLFGTWGSDFELGAWHFGIPSRLDSPRGLATQRESNRALSQRLRASIALIEKMPGAQALRNTTRISKMTSTKPSPPLG